jgi:hypothetical protein
MPSVRFATEEPQFVAVCSGPNRGPNGCLQPVHDRYELILLFNLQQRFYLPADIIRVAVDNLAASLNEGGVLIVRNTV